MSNSEHSLLNPEDILNPKFGFRNLQGLSVPANIALIMTPGVDLSDKKIITQTLNFMTCRLDLVNSNIGVVTKLGMGAPALVHYVEMLHALGGQNFFLFGTAGSLDPQLKIGDLVCCSQAWSDEGVSIHYVEGQSHFSPTTKAYTQLQDMLGPLPAAKTWTTDAPFRETKKKVDHFRGQGCGTVEMEASALFALAQYRGFEAAAIFAISDELKEDRWKSGFRKAKSNLQDAFDTFVAKLSL